ncbi:MAG: cell division protein SepF [Oscillospiraceae bacterium]
MGFMDELKRLARPYEDEEEEFDDFEATAPKADRSERKEKVRDIGATAPLFANNDADARKSNKVVSIHTTTRLQVVLEKRTVVLNLEKTNKELARRLLDFLSGVAYANEGTIKKVAISTYIITPYNVDIMGDLVSELENNGMY